MNYNIKLVQRVFREEVVNIKISTLNDVQATMNYFSSIRDIECYIDDNFEYLVLKLIK